MTELPHDPPVFTKVASFTFGEQQPPPRETEPMQALCEIIAPTARPFQRDKPPFREVGEGLMNRLSGHAAGYYRACPGSLLLLQKESAVSLDDLTVFGNPVLGWPHIRWLLERGSPVQEHTSEGSYVATWGRLMELPVPTRTKVDWNAGHSIGGQSKPDFTWFAGTIFAVYDR